jgi:methyltransferase
MTPLYWMVAFVIAQRSVELLIANRNTRRLLRAGGREHGSHTYPMIVILHAAWIVSIVLFIPADQHVTIGLIVTYFVLQLFRIWVIASLGHRWTTRIITLPGCPLVKTGPYRYIRHPNYVVVALEIALLPMAFDAWRLASIFTILNAIVLRHRIRAENTALAEASVPNSQSRALPDKNDGDTG